MTSTEAANVTKKLLAIAGAVILLLLSVIGFFGARAIKSIDNLTESMILNTEQMKHKTEKDSEQDKQIEFVKSDVKDHEKRLTTIEIHQ